jgi:hypothetical protein
VKRLDRLHRNAVQRPQQRLAHPALQKRRRRAIKTAAYPGAVQTDRRHAVVQQIQPPMRHTMRGMQENVAIEPQEQPVHRQRTKAVHYLGNVRIPLSESALGNGNGTEIPPSGFLQNFANLSIARFRKRFRQHGHRAVGSESPLRLQRIQRLERRGGHEDIATTHAGNLLSTYRLATKKPAA